MDIVDNKFLPECNPTKKSIISQECKYCQEKTFWAKISCSSRRNFHKTTIFSQPPGVYPHNSQIWKNTTTKDSKARLKHSFASHKQVAKVEEYSWPEISTVLFEIKLELKYEKCVVQRYMSKPFLIEDLKFDLRIYVLIAGTDPLRIFVYEEGLARLCT